MSGFKGTASSFTHRDVCVADLPKTGASLHTHSTSKETMREVYERFPSLGLPASAAPSGPLGAAAARSC